MAENVYFLYGTNPNRSVAGDSHLCEDLLQHFIVKSQNIKGVVQIPSDFEFFRGYDGRVERVHDGFPFCVKFGSQLDQAATEFYETYVEYNRKRKEQTESIQTSIFPILNKYIEQIIEIGNPIIWEPTVSQFGLNEYLTE